MCECQPPVKQSTNLLSDPYVCGLVLRVEREGLGQICFDLDKVIALMVFTL